MSGVYGRCGICGKGPLTTEHLRTHHSEPEPMTTPTTDEIDAELLREIIARRIECVPEYEGPWTCRAYGDDSERPIASSMRADLRQALDDVIDDCRLADANAAVRERPTADEIDALLAKAEDWAQFLREGTAAGKDIAAVLSECIEKIRSLKDAARAEDLLRRIDDQCWHYRQGGVDAESFACFVSDALCERGAAIAERKPVPSQQREQG